MRFAILACLLPLVALAEDPRTSVVVGVVNDNYTGTAENGRAGRYVGADDFLTVSFLARAHRDDWRAAISYEVVTSRLFGFRYDLVEAALYRTWRVDRFELQPGLGVLAKGSFGGDAIQNGFHRIKDLPEVQLPYTGSGVGLVASFAAAWPLASMLVEGDRAITSIGLRFPSNLVPARLEALASYRIPWWRLEAEALVGWRQWLNDVPGYSELVRSAPVAALGVRARIYEEFAFELGFSAIGVRNLRADPTYAPDDPTFSPQIWMLVSWQAQGRSLRERLDY